MFLFNGEVICKNIDYFQLKSCLTALDLTKQVKLFLIQPKQSSKIQTK